MEYIIKSSFCAQKQGVIHHTKLFITRVYIVGNVAFVYSLNFVGLGEWIWLEEFFI